MNDTAERLERERAELAEQLTRLDNQIEEQKLIGPEPDWWPDYKELFDSKSEWKNTNVEWRRCFVPLMNRVEARLRTRYSAPRELDEQWVERAAEAVLDEFESLNWPDDAKSRIASILRDSLAETEKGGGDETH